MKLLSALFAVACALSPVFGQSYIGRVDTVGGTTYDWQLNGPSWRRLVNSPEHGIYAVWMYSASSGTTFPDRNMRFNSYDLSTGAWAYIDPDFMQSGVSVFSQRAGYGSLAVAPGTGIVYASAHTDRPVVADLVSGGVSEGPAGYLHPVIDCSSTDRIHVAMTRIAGGLYYSAVPWDTVISLGDPGFPTHNIAASKISTKVCVLWEAVAEWPEVAYMQLSTDDGVTWSGPVELLPPTAFGGDTVTSFQIASFFPWYDRSDRLHVVANVMPVVHDTAYTMPSQIWHWCADNSPHWDRIHVAGCDPDHLLASVGYNATYADRPSIGEDHDGRLYVAWEQFDSSNVEPLTNYLRAGIWVSSSRDNGLTWSPGVLLTERNTYSHRFPSIVDRMVPGSASGDTVCVLYMMDSIAGFYAQGEPGVSLNPIVCQFVPAPEVGVEESPKPQAASYKPAATILAGASGVKRLASSVVYDAMGRRVRDPKPGVYFVRDDGRRARDAGRMQKVVIQR